MKYDKEIVEAFLDLETDKFVQMGKKRQYKYDPVYNFLFNRIKGNTIQDSCAMSGISEDTIYRWKKEFKKFSEADKKAEIIFKTIHIKKIATNKAWQASAWLLERRYNDEYGNKMKVDSEVTTHDGDKNPFDALTIEEQLEIIPDI